LLYVRGARVLLQKAIELYFSLLGNFFKDEGCVLLVFVGIMRGKGLFLKLLRSVAGLKQGEGEFSTTKTC